MGLSIIPAERTPWDVIGKKIGANISENLPGAIEKGYERGLGLNAIEQLQTQLKETGGDINKMLPALAKAYTLNPQLERSGLGQTFLQQAQRKVGTEDFPVGKNMPTRQGETPEEQIPVSVSDLVPTRPSMIKDPQGTSNFQLPYGPEEIAAIRQASRQKGYTPEAEERFVADAMEFNQVAKNRRDIELQNYQQQTQERADTLQNQQAFEKYLATHDPEFAANPDELELALKASEKYQKEPSFAARNAKVKEELRPYQAAKNALKKGLTRPLFGQTEDQLELLRPRAQFMVNAGQKPQLQLMIANGGMGEAEEANLLNPLPKDLDKSLKGFQKFKNPLESVTNISPESSEFQEQLNRGRSIRSQQENFATNYLSNIIKPGQDYNHPGTNLILVRKHLMDKGASWEESGKIIDSAIEKGKIKLDPHQQIDYQKLAYPPLTGDTYFDTIMNNLMFPVTGKQ